MPRPVKDDPRDCHKSFRFTGAEITRLEARARAQRQTLSDYVRARILDPEAHETGPPPAKATPSSNREKLDAYYARRGEIAAIATGARDRMAARLLAEQMRRVGVNLNQIARRMNEQRIPPPRELTMVLDEIRAYVREVREP
jgi:Bacterial mobilisation protein (MobC)